jgi:hypothetical protein
MRQVIRYVCSECNQEHHSPEWAERCEKQDKERKADRAEAVAKEKYWTDKGHDVWYERSGMKNAPKVDPTKFGKHDFGDQEFTQDCSYGCGCWMGSSASGGPVNPFGPCPNNPHPVLLNRIPL